ncbi:hypothetical protein HHI36_017107 [Cryptolaemus montrouzieri]|uniref:Uncharacterized protein n=1 Tax=Cryptolaemus montrouzieri TaxID=559131 RepID=A0ABD2NLI5_9CUCU
MDENKIYKGKPIQTIKTKEEKTTPFSSSEEIQKLPKLVIFKDADGNSVLRKVHENEDKDRRKLQNFYQLLELRKRVKKDEEVFDEVREVKMILMELKQKQLDEHF